MIFYSVQAQFIQLPREVKCKTGDNMTWATPSFNDADWGNQLLGTSLKNNGIKENIYAWFRIKIVIPSGMKVLAEQGKGLQLHLGRIDDIDQTFFNGKLLGQTGSFPPDYQSRYQSDRLYIIPVNEVRWDKENVIAVRIFSPDSIAGMYQGPYNFGPFQWTDFISVQQNITETANNGFITKVTFTNKRAVAFDGTIKYRVADKNDKELFTETKPVHVIAEQGNMNEVTFSDYQPVNEQIFKVGYQVTENGNPVTLKKEQIYLANKNIDIKVAAEPTAVIENKIKDEYTSIPFQNQQLQGYLGKRSVQNLEERLLKIDENGIIDGYLNRPGDHPWYGEHVGKYLEAACNVWKVTHDARLKKQMDRIMYELINSQLADGYLGTYLTADYWTGWDVWSHKYNLYGLLAYYKTTGYKPALETCKRMGDLLCTTFGNNPGQRDIILAGEHMGMAATSVLDPMVELYKYTGEKKYLDFCYYILDAWEHNNGPKIISSLLSTGKVNKVANGKAYEMLSNLVGLANLYRVTGDVKLLKPVLIAWQDIVTNRLYITGTTSSFEHFQNDAFLPAEVTSHMGEGCVTVTWIQFNQQLLAFTGDSKYIEQIEKSIYNHLLGAENPETGCVSYYTPLMGKKPYSCGISCCTSSVPRGIAMIPYFTLGNVRNTPTLMLYEPATYKENITTAGGGNINLSMQVESNFPEKSGAIVTVKTSQPAIFTIALRVPSWCRSFVANVGGKNYKGIINQTLTIKRDWKSGDKVKVSFKMPVQIKAGGKSYPGQIAFQRGPQVLALDSLLNIEVLKKVRLSSDQKPVVEKPSGKSDATLLPTDWIGKQAYAIDIINKNRAVKKQQLILVPFADAGQTGGAIKVWMPLSIISK